MNKIRFALVLFILAGLVPLIGSGYLSFEHLRESETKALAEASKQAKTALRTVEDRYYTLFEQLIRKESGREFTEFQHWFAPLDIEANAPSVIRSPLSRLPENPFVKGYFQLTGKSDKVLFSSPLLAQVRDSQKNKLLNNLKEIKFETRKNQVEEIYQEFQQELPSFLLSLPNFSSEVSQDLKIPHPLKPFEPNPIHIPTEFFAKLRSSTQPLEKWSIPNETLLMNDQQWQIIKEARLEAMARKNLEKKMRLKNHWENLNHFDHNKLDLTQNSTVEIDAYQIFWKHQEKQKPPFCMLWRTVHNPVEKTLQALQLDFEFIFNSWLPQQIKENPDLQIQFRANSLNPAKVLAFFPEEENYQTLLRKQLPSLPLVAAPDFTPIREGFATTRKNYWILALSYSGLLFVLAFLLGKTILRHEKFVQQQQSFVATASHELRTPLSSIRLYTEMLEKSLQTSEPSQKNQKTQRYVDKILHEQERLTRLVEMVLVSNQIEQGSFSLRLEEADLELPLLEALQKAQAIHPGKMISYQRKEPAFTACDKTAASQLFFNLLDNALKYSPAELQPVTISTFSKQNRFHVVIEDSGKGIPEKELHKIFQPFYRGQEATFQGPGTGLGLWISKAYAQKMGWEITLTRSQTLGGTKAEVIIPLNQETSKP